MQGAYIDSIITAFRGRSRQENSLKSKYMRLYSTQAGTLRVLDTGGSKQPVLIAPDGPCVIEHYDNLIELLSPNFRVVCFDLPGFGFSYPALGYNFSIAQTAESVVELMDLLGIGYAALALTCANGFVALHVAKHYPNRVSHLVLGQTPSFQSMRQWNDRIIPKILHVPYVGQLITAGLARKFSDGWYDLALPRASNCKFQFVQHADHALKSGGCFCLASLIQGLSHTQDAELGEVSVPTLLIYGNKDRSHKHTDFASLRDHVSAAEIIMFQGCGHFPDIERPQEYASYIKSFVNTAA